MNFLDLVKYTGTQLTTDTFNISVSSGFETLPSGQETTVTIRDSAGTYAVVTGTLAGVTFTVAQLLGSRTGTIPTFSGTVTITSTLGAGIINRGYGIGGLPVIGQSNAVGFDGSYDALLDYNNGNVTQFRFDANDNAGNPYTPDDVFIAQDPLFWAEQTTVANSVSPVPHMAKALVKYGGHKAIEILPGAQGSTAFGAITSGVGIPGEQWIKTGVLYERLKDMTISFLQRNDDNYLAAVVMMLGESDALEGVTELEFSDFTDDFWTDFKADILSATSYDMSFVPFVIVGMNDAFIAFEANGVNIENSMIDAPNRITRSSYVSMTGQANADNFHHTTASNRNLGRDLFIPGYFAALENWTFFGTGLAGTINATASVAANFKADLSGSINATATATGDFSAGAALAGTISATASVVGDVVVPAPLTLDAEFLAGVGVTKNGSNQVSEWADQTGNGFHLTQSGADSLKPTDVSGTGLLFDGSNDRMDMPSGLLSIINSTTGYTVILQYTTTSSGTVMTGADHSFISLQASTTNFRMQDSTGSDDFVGSDTNDGSLHYCAMSVDRSGGIKEVIIDGVVENTDSSILSQSSDAPAWFLGSGSSGTFPAFFWAGEVHNMGIKEEAMTLTQIEAVVAGW